MSVTSFGSRVRIAALAIARAAWYTSREMSRAMDALIAGLALGAAIGFVVGLAVGFL